MIVLQLYSDPLILAERVPFLNILWHWKSSRGKNLRLCLWDLIDAHLRSIEWLFVLLLWLLSRPVSREDCPIVVLSSSWDQYLPLFVLLLMAIRCEFLVQTFKKLHLFLIFILFVFYGCKSYLFWICSVRIPRRDKCWILSWRLGRRREHPPILCRLQHVPTFDIFNVVIRRTSEQLGKWLIVRGSCWDVTTTLWIIKLLLSFLAGFLLSSPVRLWL